MNSTPVPYQFQAELVARLSDPKIQGRLIGDEPGLGKTYEALWIHKNLVSSYNHCGQKQRTLIIAPWSVHEAWARAIVAVFGHVSIAMIDRKKRAPFVQAALAGKAEFYICHYEALRIKDMSPVLHIRWFHVIADEIHRIKSEKSQQRLAVRRLRTRYKTGLSASLAEDKPQDIWSPLNWVAPTDFPSLKAFRTQWCLTEEIQGRVIGFDEETGEPIHLIHEAIAGMRPDRLPAFHERIEPFVMRRRKKEVGLDLPDKYFTIINVQLSPKQRRIYNDLRRKMLAWIGEHEDQKLSVPHTLSRLVRLQQAALATLEFTEEYATIAPDLRGMKPKVRLIEPSAKLNALLDWIEDRSDQVVIFSQSRGMVRLVDDRLRQNGRKVGLYVGSTPDNKRQGIIDDFQAGKLDVFLSTIATGGESITLTASSTVVFLDRLWGPFKNMQAEDRVHRIGQKNAVEVVDFFAPGTVDDKVRNTNIRKWGQLRALLGDIDD